MSRKNIGLAAAALTGLLVLSTSVAPVMAAPGGHGGGGGGHGFSGGGHAPGGGARGFSGRSSPGARSYGYAPRGGPGHVHRPGRGFAGYPYGYPYGYYGYGYGYSGACSYEYNRAIATNNPYWWNQYYACAD